MYQIDLPSAAPAMPAAEPSAAPGYFTGGDPASATPPTIAPIHWWNAVMLELLAVVAAGGMPPSKLVYTQVRDAIVAMINTAVNALSVMIAAEFASLLARTITGSGLASGGGDLTASRTITVPKASAADVLAGTDDTKAVTPLALAGNMSLAATGYYKHPGGYIEQWGHVTTPAGSEHATALAFPIAFPTECLGISFTTINSASSNNGDVTYQEVSLTAAGANIFVVSDSSDIDDGAGGYRWRAWGH